jgi:hypothetical protein
MGTGRMPRTLAPRPSRHDEETRAAPREGEPTDGRAPRFEGVYVTRRHSRCFPLSHPEVFFLPLPPAEFRSGARSTTHTQARARSRRRDERRRQRRAPRARKHTSSRCTRHRCPAREEAAERMSPAHERRTRAREDR